jgi:uncharacterized protein with HEPN domain
MPLPSDRHSRLYLEDMLAFCERALAYTGSIDRDGLAADAMRLDATLRNLELIGEAATHVPDEMRAQAPANPWRRIIATRNRLIHAYLGIDLDTVWSILRDDLPTLRTERRRVLSAST